MRFMLRWIANSIAFYLALYLLDSLVAPRFWVQAVWAAVVLAVFLALVNSLFRPLHKLRTRPRRAIIVALFTLLVNALVLQIFVWAGARLATAGAVWVLVAAAFLATLGGAINWLIGFRTMKKPGSSARPKKSASRTPERDTKSKRKRDQR